MAAARVCGTCGREEGRGKGPRRRHPSSGTDFWPATPTAARGRGARRGRRRRRRARPTRVAHLDDAGAGSNLLPTIRKAKIVVVNAYRLALTEKYCKDMFLFSLGD